MSVEESKLNHRVKRQSIKENFQYIKKGKKEAMAEWANNFNLQIFEQIQEIYKKKTKLNLIIVPEVLCKIYDELKEKGIQLIAFLAQGGQGMVFEAKKKDEIIIVKCIQIVNLEKTEEEVQILEKLKGIPNTCQLIDSFNSNKKNFNFQIFKKYSCDLKNIMECAFEKKKSFLLNQIIYISLQISQAIANLPNMFHSDLKPSNIFYDDVSKSFDLSDFGATKEFKDGKSFTNNVGLFLYQQIISDNLYPQLKFKALDLKYRAPEMQEENLNLTKKYDIFSLGLVILEMTLGRFIDNLESNQIRKGNLDQYLSYDQAHVELNQILKLMLKVEQTERIAPQELVKKLNELKEIVEIKFINSVLNVINDQRLQSMIQDFKQYFQEYSFEFKENKTKLNLQEIGVQVQLNIKQFEDCISQKNGWLILNLNESQMPNLVIKIQIKK
ncbi:hypothetical protein ABPG72_021178 [Tetrahymena utriculariae]